MEAFKLPGADEEQAGLLRLGLHQEWDEVTAGFTTRDAGNTALHVGDDLISVIERRRSVADRLGWDFAAWTCAEQVHGTHVYTVRKTDAGRGSLDRASAVPDADALITDEPDILLVQYFADCVPLYFLDPVTGAMGLAHAGWKGTVANIAGQTVSKMSEAFGAKPDNLIAAIGPSIGDCCYEVDEAVIRRVRPISEQSDVLMPTAEGKARLDLKQLNRHLMIKAGILPSRIEMSSWCTGCRTDLFFSHRMENGATGRMMSWLGRKSR
ncbi:peptidoglycan editing factor PgeF [Cohnella pontilimi]|uniref:Purine nucleoside phosphorylase n=1 Tax=Cohnella pontilimi TaxID=2564100 RepID=A0A4U0FIT1_9BACL|nr:peptidoglycan editing factor PgeF [Cohnella pontilimi]TJY43362.1 peptidoglycan editing factor PgeF [Cohnella pontilimi]